MGTDRKEQQHIDPPKWMDRLMAFYCDEYLLEDLQGDLYEYFQRNLKNKGLFMARIIYLIDVIKFCRTYTVKTPELLQRLNFFAVFKNSFKTSYRNILRNKLFSGINVIGLAISMSVGLLVIVMIMELGQFDSFHSKSNRIYRITNSVAFSDEPMLFATSSILAAEKIRDEFVGVEDVVITNDRFSIDAKYKDRAVPINGKYANEAFATVFDFEVLEGDFQFALREANSIALTQSIAERLFGEEEALNQVITTNEGQQMTVRAILADLPDKTHMTGQAFCAFKTLETVEGDKEWFKEWDNMWSNHIYVLLDEANDTDRLQQQLDQLSSVENESVENAISLGYIPLTGIIPGPEMSNMMGPGFDIKTIWILTSLAAIILLSACFNYTNLSVARSLRRSKEVGVRKTVGASNGHLFFQFVTEAVMVSLIALVVALPFFYLASPLLIESLRQGGILTLDLTPSIGLAFLFYAVMIGVVAGLFPSWVMSRMKVNAVLRDVSSLKLYSNISLRKALVVFQFSLSMVFIISAFIGYSQYQYMLNFDLGYNTENVLNVATQKNQYEILEAEFRKLPQVEDVSFSLMIPSEGSYTEIVKDSLTQDSVEVTYNRVNHQYLSLHEHRIIAGTDFEQHGTYDMAMEAGIVNEEFLTTFNITEPEAAIGREFQLYRSEWTVRIIGVIEDFHHGTTEEESGPYLLMNGVGTGDEEWPSYYEMNLKLKPGDRRETMAALEEAWNRIDAVHQFKAEFYSETIAYNYNFLKSLINIIGALATIAISIAAMGLLGMVVFTTETRLKEIGIRKILGATEGNLLLLLGRSFILLLFIAAVVAVPVTYYAFSEYILSDYIYREQIGWWELGGGSLLIFLIGTAIVCAQTLFAARTNPADMIRKE